MSTPEPIANWLDEDRFIVDSVKFTRRMVRARENAGVLGIAKSRGLIEEYIRVVSRVHPRRIFEIGIHAGGSTALLALLARPELLVAVDVDPEPPVALETFRRARALTEVIKPYAGVDQGDRLRLGEIARQEFGDRPIDMVIDDASHKYEETKASFETLFPLLRPGALYCIEDWNWEHHYHDGIRRELRKKSMKSAKPKASRGEIDKSTRRSTQASPKEETAPPAGSSVNALLSDDTPVRMRGMNSLLAAASDEAGAWPRVVTSVFEAAAAHAGLSWHDGSFASVCRDPNDSRHRLACSCVAYRLRAAELANRQAPKPLSRLAVDLLLVRASGFSDVVRNLSINKYWAVITRGEDHIDPSSFRIANVQAPSLGLFEG